MNTKTDLSIFQKNLEFQYTRQRRAEFLIAIGRLMLAAFSLLAVSLDPSEPGKYAQVIHILFYGYVAYSVLMTVLLLRVNMPLGNLPLFTHAFDLLLFTLIMFLTEGPTSPFFVYFLFSLFCATLRWSWRGTLWTAAVALMLFLGIGVYAGAIIHDPAFELNRFIIRSVSLVVAAILVSYLGVYEERLRGELLGLAAWPRTIHKETQPLVCEMLQHAADILHAPSTLLAWEEEEEPWLHLASWSRGQFHYTREPPAVFGTLIAEPLGGTDFLCRDTRVPVPTVIHTSPAGLQVLQGKPLNSKFQARFDIRGALSLSIKGEGLKGWLFVLDKKGMTSDDLVLGRIVAQGVVTELDYFYLLKQLERSAAAEERIRMARDLHDGLLQSLTGAALQLEALHRLTQTDPAAARQRLLEIQQLIAAEQRDLRSHIKELKGLPMISPEIDSNLDVRLKELAERIERHWGIRVEMRLERLTSGIPHPLSQEIYFIVHESLINAAQHAHASSVRADLGVEDNHVNITISDDGHGFPFQGRYDHTTLTTLKLGPVALRERAIALGGSLTVESTDTGASLEITIPLPLIGD